MADEIDCAAVVAVLMPDREWHAVRKGTFRVEHLPGDDVFGVRFTFREARSQRTVYAPIMSLLGVKAATS